MITVKENNGCLHVKLIDFGTAKIFEEGNMQRGLVGSSYYIAPEIIKGDMMRNVMFGVLE